MFEEGTPIRKKALGWAYLLATFGVLGIILFGTATHNVLIEVTGGILFVCGLLWMKRSMPAAPNVIRNSLRS